MEEVSIQKMILNILKKHNIKKQKLANKIGVSPSQITRWMKGAEPKITNLKKLQEIYDKFSI